MKDFTTIMPRRDGASPELWESLSAANIPIESAVSFSREHHRVLHIVVEDAVADRTRAVLEEEGILIADTRDVILVPLDEYPGGLAEITRAAYDADLGVYLMALATDNRVMLGVADVETARKVFLS